MPSYENCSLDDLHFPIVSVTQSGTLYVHSNRNSLEVTHTTLIRRGWYHGMTIVDSNGEAYKVTKVVQLGGEGPFWGYSLFYARRVRLEIGLKYQHRMTLAEMKGTVSRAMKRDPHMWEAALWENGVRGWEEKVQLTDSISGIFELLASNQ